LPAVVAAPAVALATNALADQHSDNLLLAIYSVEHPFDRYLPRFLPLVQFMSSPISDYSANLRFQVLLRVFAFCFTVSWIGNRVARAISGSYLGAIIGSIVLAGYFLVRYPEASDSIVYGASAGLQASVVFIASLAVIQWARHSANAAWRASLIIAAVLLVCLALLNYFMLVLWAPILVLLDSLARAGAQPRPARVVFREVFGGKISPLWVLTAASAIAFAYFRWTTSERTSITPSRALGVVRWTRYAWDQGNLYIFENLRLVLVLSILLVVGSRKMRGFLVAGLSMCAAGSVLVVASLDHVAENVHLPRYYAPSLFIGLLIVVAAAASLIAERVSRSIPSGMRLGVVALGETSRNRFSLVAVVALFYVASLGIFVTRPIGFGFEGADGQQIRKQGFPLSAGDIQLASERGGVDIDFVMGSHWQVWTTVFRVGEEGMRVFPFASFTRALDRSDEYIPNPPVYGVCIDLDARQCKDAVQWVLSPGSPWELTVLGPLDIGTGRVLHLAKLGRK
jgi:hypothetical protein